MGLDHGGIDPQFDLPEILRSLLSGMRVTSLIDVATTIPDIAKSSSRTTKR
jgi:hypothetical protein